jgi:3'-5' exonuclease
MGSNIIVWDLETVPDLGGFAAANDLVGKSDVEVREAIGDKFPKHIYHSIVCIGALIAHREQDHWAVDAVGAPHVGERTEKELITAFCDKIAELSPQLVTFNGNSFDLPVLRYRAMVHGISARGLSARPYFHRHTEDAIDLCDEHVKRLRVKDKTQRKIARSSSMDSHGFCAWIIRWQSEHSSCS